VNIHKSHLIHVRAHNEYRFPMSCVTDMPSVVIAVDIYALSLFCCGYPIIDSQEASDCIT